MVGLSLNLVAASTVTISTQILVIAPEHRIQTLFKKILSDRLAYLVFWLTDN